VKEAESRTYAPELESLRGIAIVLVVLSHADGMLAEGVKLGQRVLDPLLAFVDSGHTGVTLFFVLSGFLLSRPFLAELRSGPRVSLRHFAARRALRILPMYWLAVAISVALHRSSGAGLSDAFGYAVFLHSFTGVVTYLPFYSSVWWSLATEIQFYLVLPLAALLLRLRFGWILLCSLSVLYVVAYVCTASTGFPLDSNLSLGLFGRAPSFAFGIAAAWLHDRHGIALQAWCARQRWLANGGTDVLMLAILTALGFLLESVSIAGYFTAETTRHAWHVLEAALWTAVMLLVLLAPLRLRVVLDNAVLRWLGLVSYSIYLIHLPVLFHLIIRLAPGQTWTSLGTSAALLALAITLVLSAATYRWIERPFLARKPRIYAAPLAIEVPSVTG
jgi:peptidoglycan/LPS O-acetylase OafA/YrhL